MNNTDVIMKFGLDSEEFTKVIEGKKKYLVLPPETEYYEFPRLFPKNAMIEVINLGNLKQHSIFKVTDHNHEFEDAIIVSIAPMVGAASISELDGRSRQGGRVTPA